MGLNQRKPIGFWLSLGLVLLLGWGCDSSRRGFADLEAVEGFAGMVAADEPRAAVIARDLLNNGASAADAAVAMYFTMAVTLPSRVGLLGGGTCVAYSHGRETAEVFEFLPKAGPDAFALPRAVRAMAILHARHGRVRWIPLVTQAENLARSGHGISRAFAQDLIRGVGTIRRNRDLSRLFMSKSGGLPKEGDHLVQAELSTVLAGIRSQGAGYFHAGAFPVQLVRAAAEGGQTWAIEDLRAALPRVSPATALDAGDYRLYFTLPLAGDGAVAATLWRILNEVQPYGQAAAGERPGLFVESAELAFSEARRWQRVHDEAADPEAALRDLLDRDRLQALVQAGSGGPNGAGPSGGAPAPLLEGASFVVADRWGDAVACGTSMNGLFGSGRIAPSTGMLLAGRPDASGLGAALPSVALMADPDDGDAHLALAASGGTAAVSALVQVLLAHLTEAQPLAAAVSAPRLHYSAQDGAVQFESRNTPATVGSLGARGYRLREVRDLGLVNGLHCPEGLADGAEDCSVVSDPRAWGSVTRVE